MKRGMGLVMLVVAAASGSMTGAASAADLRQPYTKAPVTPATPAFDWSGFYAGLYTAGARVGYNHQFGTFVLGGEANVGHAGGLKSKLDDGGTLKQTWNSGVRARAGFAINHVLLYGLAGYNLTKFEAGGTVTSGDKWKSGFDVGAGFEYAVTKYVAIGLEYDYSRFDSVKFSIGGATKKKNIDDHAIRAGVNVRF
jgi:outer membrane immunogenic protein